MNNFPYIEASFVIEGKYFNLEDFTEKIGIWPSETRGIDDWPSTIKNSLHIPEELQPRCVWQISQKEESCMRIEMPIRKIISKLKGKEEFLIKFCEEKNLKKGLIIFIHAEVMNLPEIVLPPEIVSYFGSIKVEISFDLYVY